MFLALDERTGPGGHVYGKNEVPAPQVYDGATQCDNCRL